LKNLAYDREIMPSNALADADGHGFTKLILGVIYSFTDNNNFQDDPQGDSQNEGGYAGKSCFIEVVQ